MKFNDGLNAANGETPSFRRTQLLSIALRARHRDNPEHNVLTLDSIYWEAHFKWQLGMWAVVVDGTWYRREWVYRGIAHAINKTNIKKKKKNTSEKRQMA